MPVAVVIALKDLRQRLRDRSAVVLGLVAPLVVAGLISVAFGGADTFHTDVAVVDHDGGHLATAFQRLLHDPALSGVLSVKPVRDEPAARRQVAAGTLGAAFVVPPGWTAAVQGSGRVPPVTVLAGVDAPVAAQVARSVAESFTAQLDADRLSVAAALSAGAAPDRVAELGVAAARQQLPESVVSRAAGTKVLTGRSYYAPAMGMFFMLFAIGFGARGFFQERAAGTLDRIAAAPVAPASILLGSSLATFVYGALSLGTVAAVTSWVFHADWGPPPAVIALILALSLALVGLTALVIAVARTQGQADGLASMLTFGLVLLGGNFTFIGAAPEPLRRLSLLTPNGWALRAFTDLSGGAGWTSAVPALLAILAFGAVAAGGALLLRRRVLP